MTDQNPETLSDTLSTPVGGRDVQDQPVADGQMESKLVGMSPAGATSTDMTTPQSNPVLEAGNPWRQGLASNQLPYPPQQPWQLASSPQHVLHQQPAAVTLHQPRYRVLDSAESNASPGGDIGLRDSRPDQDYVDLTEAPQEGY